VREEEVLYLAMPSGGNITGLKRCW